MTDDSAQRGKYHFDGFAHWMRTLHLTHFQAWRQHFWKMKKCFAEAQIFRKQRCISADHNTKGPEVNGALEPTYLCKPLY